MRRNHAPRGRPKVFLNRASEVDLPTHHRSTKRSSDRVISPKRVRDENQIDAHQFRLAEPGRASTAFLIESIGWLNDPLVVSHDRARAHRETFLREGSILTATQAIKG